MRPRQAPSDREPTWTLDGGEAVDWLVDTYRGPGAIDDPPPPDAAPPTDARESDVANAGFCPVDSPGQDSACTVPEMEYECRYLSRTCPDGTPLLRLCNCTNGRWSCLQDLGCPDHEPAGGTPEQRCGACTAGATCSYRIGTCPAAEDLRNRCTCTGGTWTCSPDVDCPLPNTCRRTFGPDCVTNGVVNTGPFCPAGYLQALCTDRPCTPAQVGREGCIPPPGDPARRAVCVHGQWACPLGYGFPVPLR